MQKLSLIDETFDLNFISEYHLSIQFGLDGLSFCTLDGIQKKYVQLAHQPIVSNDPSFLVKHIRNFYEENENLNNEYKSTHIIFATPKASLIPPSYFQQKKTAEVIDLNFGKTTNETILNSGIPPFSGELVFRLPSRLSDFIKEQHPQTKITHECAPFIWNANNSIHTDNFMAVLIRKDYVWLIYIAKNQAIFINSFSYQTDDDILYFIMNVFSSLEVSPEKTPVFMEGITSKRSAIYHRVRQYIKHVQLSGAHPDFHYSYLLDQLPDTRFVTMLNLQACAL